MRMTALMFVAVLLGTAPVAHQQTPTPAAPASQATATNLGTDANGNPLRRVVKTGHISN